MKTKAGLPGLTVALIVILLTGGAFAATTLRPVDTALLEGYQKIQQALAEDSLKTVSENAAAIAKTVRDDQDKKIPFEIKLHTALSAQDAATLRQCMRDLHLSHGYLVHSGRQDYSLGNGITALPAEQMLSHPEILWR